MLFCFQFSLFYYGVIENLYAREIIEDCFNVILFVQCGQGSTDDELSPTCVSSLLGIEMQGIAAGLWHTVCISADGSVYAFGGNQFGQLGTGADQAEVHFLDHPIGGLLYPGRGNNITSFIESI